MITISSVIQKLEQATEGSWELDCEIYEIFHGPEGDEPWPGCPAHYTTSVDAALTLVPEGWRVEDLSQGRQRSLWYVNLWPISKKNWDDNEKQAYSEDRPSPALALCIAALRARLEPDGQLG